MDVDALIITAPSNIRYTCGFTGSNGTVIVGKDGLTLVTDRRYVQWAEDEIAASGSNAAIVIAPGSGRTAVLEAVHDVKKVGLEADHVSWASATSLISSLGVDRVRATTNTVEALREIKDASEIELMGKAAAMADFALAELLTRFGPGPTEREIARDLDQLVLAAGASGASFETIVASGPNAARPHHSPSDRRLEKGDLVIIDFGAECAGYRSDMTRSFVLGTPTTQQKEMLDAVLGAQQAGVDAVSAGVPASSIDDVCRSSLASVSLDQWFVHGTGHGVGLDIHEAPSVSATATATLAPGHVITVEPGVYIPDVGGVRWEDTVVVTTNGAEPLTSSPKLAIVN
jgi:Xaa-Pro aminopeptidase